MSLDCFNWLTSVKNIHLDAIFFYSKCIFNWDRAILAVILDLRTPIEICMTFDCFNGSAIVKNLGIDANIVTLGAILVALFGFEDPH